MTKKLGTLSRVELRTIWQTEPRNFTPWLTEEENLKILSDTIGLDLELEVAEKDVGPFRADILCKNTEDDSWVVIENQLEITDHRHLGQLLTYAAGLDAVNIIWISKKMREEHRSALDWLNEITDDNFRFFGLELELWQIDDSLPALKFNIASQPNNWKKTYSRLSKGESSNYDELRFGYWDSLSKYLDAQKSKIRMPTPSKRRHRDIPAFNTNAILRAAISTKSGETSITILLQKDMKGKYSEILKQKDQLKNKFNLPLEFNESTDEQKASTIKLKGNFEIINSDNNWKDSHKWFKDNLETCIEVFEDFLTR